MDPVMTDEGFWDFFAGVMNLFFFVGVLALLAGIFWLWMLIDALANEPRTEDKLLWFLVIFLLSFLGAVIYFIVRRSKRPPAESAAMPSDEHVTAWSQRQRSPPW